MPLPRWMRAVVREAGQLDDVLKVDADEDRVGGDGAADLFALSDHDITFRARGLKTRGTHLVAGWGQPKSQAVVPRKLRGL